ncbi:YdcF family protein [Brevibacillus laterosporus]|uniref:YdcF family protein n=1 Tax=Brevibacillus laterosporus TaxID=1465 RepID=UPI0024056869|nr:YdcF family protein [Brevibacillus laterosporus]MDF9411897.1 YdcF family protein [Brevibacillus laterosporus]
MKGIIIKIISIMFAWFVMHVLITSLDGLFDEKQQVDLAVILGNKVENDGRPSDRLRYRLNKAVDLYNQGYFKYVLVSGGVGKEGFDEAQIMKQYLVQKNIPSDKIITDSMGLNTIMTAQNTRKISEDMEIKSVMVITQFYHISRTKLAFYKLGFEDVYSSHAEYFELRDFYSLFREFFAYYKYLIFE